MAETSGQTLKPAFWHNSLKHSRADHKAVRKQKSRSTAPASEAGKYVCPKCGGDQKSRQLLDYHHTANPWWLVRPCFELRRADRAELT